MTEQVGDIWAVPPMPQEEWLRQPIEVWRAVEAGMRLGWAGKLNDAYRLTGRRVMDLETARRAMELGDRGAQMFTACKLRQRLEVDGG